MHLEFFLVSHMKKDLDIFFINDHFQASKAYSKTWSFREDALVAVWKELSEVGPSETQGEVRRKLKATVQIILKGIKDKILAVSMQLESVIVLVQTYVLTCLFNKQKSRKNFPFS